MLPGMQNAMIIAADSSSAPVERRSQTHGTQFAAVMAQCGATPPFSPWPVPELAARNGLVSSGASLNAHPTTSNRREGRHARG